MTDFALQLAALEEDKVTPGLLGFTVVALLAMATWLLLRSMNKQIRRVNFEEPPPRREVPTQRDDTPDAPESGAAPDEADDATDDDTADNTADNRETQGNGAK